MTLGLPRDANGALSLTTVTAGATWSGGFLRAPTGELVADTAGPWTNQRGFKRTAGGALGVIADGTVVPAGARGLPRDSADLLVVTATGPGTNVAGFRRDSAGRLVAVGLTSPPINTLAPAITGSAYQDLTLTLDVGTWSGTPVITYTQKWQNSPDGSVWTDIGGATATTYVPQATDVGKVIRAVVTATNAYGAPTANSNTTATVAGFVQNLATFATGTGTVTSAPLTVPAGGVPANHTIVIMGATAADVTVTVADTRGNSYSVRQQISAGGSVKVHTANTKVVTPLLAGDTITITISAGTNCAWTAADFTGLGVLDGSQFGLFASTATATGGAVTTTVNGCLVVGAFAVIGTSAILTPGAGYHDGTGAAGTVTLIRSVDYEYKFQATAAAITPTATLNTTPTQGAGYTLAFRPG